jgi:hypothetical protein
VIVLLLALGLLAASDLVRARVGGPIWVSLDGRGQGVSPGPCLLRLEAGATRAMTRVSVVR